MAKLLTSVFTLLLLTYSTTAAEIDGPATAFTTRYWDCCKPSCAWADKAPFVGNTPVSACDVDNKPIADAQTGTGCNGGTAYACANQSPTAVNDTFSYGFVGAFLHGGTERNWCCSCYELEFLDTAIKGKKMIVQASNTDYEMGGNSANVFTFGIPAGNTSYANACSAQYGVNNATFGQEFVGISTRDQCDDLPEALKPGCFWRFDWFQDAIHPSVSYRRVSCPQVLTNVTGCTRSDEATFVASNGTAKPGLAAVNALPSLLSSTMVMTGVLFVSWVLFV